MLTLGKKEIFTTPYLSSFAAISSKEAQHEETTVVWDDEHFVLCPEDVKVMDIKANVGNNPDCQRWSFSQYAILRELIVGNECFQYIKDLSLKEMDRLERVVIGKKCFCLANGGALEVVNC